MAKEVRNEAQQLLNNSVAVAAIVFVLVVGLGVGYLGGSANQVTNTVTNVLTQTERSSTTVPGSSTGTTSTEAKGAVVNLVLIPDFGGAGYDAFVKAANINATAPKLATSSSKPGPNNNNVTVTAGVAVKFVIASIDTAVLRNFTGTVTAPFAIYNDTDKGQVGVQYHSGQSITNLAIGHTFTISELSLNIPIPPATIVTFTYTFSKPGVYAFFCLTPCGAGMGVAGYMRGYVVVVPGS